MAAGLQPSSIEAPCSSIVISQLHCGSLPKAGETRIRSTPLPIEQSTLLGILQT
ncbi:hypothetical protein EJ02DRAFT_427727 [Clathrospora elynae]|uniref:Uncharacterized protein n=1 Tax=Clathrospora elynae TaxID=706981 RepID=A0A6A5SFI9_9PLEO|nr:hypothetical protein EJ02DRAFT_427727 [Clathrospora elynae]